MHPSDDKNNSDFARRPASNSWAEINSWGNSTTFLEGQILANASELKEDMFSVTFIQ